MDSLLFPFFFLFITLSLAIVDSGEWTRHTHARTLHCSCIFHGPVQMSKMSMADVAHDIICQVSKVLFTIAVNLSWQTNRKMWFSKQPHKCFCCCCQKFLFFLLFSLAWGFQRNRNLSKQKKMTRSLLNEVNISFSQTKAANAMAAVALAIFVSIKNSFSSKRWHMVATTSSSNCHSSQTKNQTNKWLTWPAAANETKKKKKKKEINFLIQSRRIWGICVWCRHRHPIRSYTPTVVENEMKPKCD